jgi:hypothetical protein
MFDPPSPFPVLPPPKASVLIGLHPCLRCILGSDAPFFTWLVRIKQLDPQWHASLAVARFVSDLLGNLAPGNRGDSNV